MNPRIFWFLFIGACSLSFGEGISVTGRVVLFHGAAQSSDSSGAVVWLTPADSSLHSYPAPSGQHVQLLQKAKTFSPHLLVIPVGASVAFPNQDPFFHNVFSLFDGKRFDLGLYESGSTRSVVFNREGISYIFCNIHPEMSAIVIALKTPYYGITNRNGLITIANVPSGTYEMHVWHERVLPESLKPQTRRVQIGSNADSLGVLHLTEQPDIGPQHKNKYGHDYDSPTPAAPIYSRQ